ncbi:MAG: hypothetical protein JXA97_03685 [Anaerolineales bacterium]|nr:hypothetical protein [Anaerolineales bacterium]
MKRLSLWILVSTFLLAPIAGLQAQDGAELELSLRRDFGYGMGGDIQGKFTLSASGPDDLVQVAFLFDGDVVYVAEELPFEIVFHTGDYDFGVHVLTAEGTRADGSTLFARQLTLNFVSAEQGWDTVGKFLIPLFIVAGVLTVLGGVLPMLEGRRGKTFEVGKYGSAGGAVCPRCALPYTRHALSMNLLLGKMERCPHCGKWAIVPGASRAALEAAENRYRADTEKGRMKTETEQAELQRRIDDSRFES